jgi:hypothetical protein
MLDEISWSKPKGESVSGPHKDYEANLRIAENFCSKVEEKIKHLGMRAYITGSHELPKSLMFISWKPPKEYPLGNCATPIFLHDATNNVNKKIEGIFNTYLKKASEVCAKYPDQASLFDLGSINGGQKV